VTATTPIAPRRRTTTLLAATLFVAVAALVAPAALAQQAAQRSPRVGYIYPAGGQRGTTFEATIGGQFLDGVSVAHFAGGPGVRATVLDHVKPLTPTQAGILRDEMRDLVERRLASLRAPAPSRGATRPATRPAWTDADDKRLAAIRARLAGYQGRPSSPSIAEIVRVRITIAADAAPGARELRLGTPALTNPLAFVVGQLPEAMEKESGRPDAPPAPTDLTLPTVVNGQVLPGDVDRYRFAATKGDRLVFTVAARDLIPYLADAVPGWFQATLALYDSSGAEVAFADDYRFSPDPVLFFEAPRDGQYTLEIRDSIYRGREDFVYRLSAGKLPFITSIFPLGGRPGVATTVELRGWNLPVQSLVLPARAEGTYPVSVQLPGGLVSNAVPFRVDDVAQATEVEPNDAPAAAQPVATLPLVINGRIDRPGDRDVVRFEGWAGQRIVVEVVARRLGSPLDSSLRLTDAAGRPVAANDDHDDPGSGLLTHHADSYLTAMLPASGTYYLHLADAQGHGGPEFAYRLRVGPPRPDFELRVSPSAVIARGGATVPLTVYALRKDGFTGEIALSFAGAPAGDVLGGGRIPANQDRVRVTVTTDRSSPDEPLPLRLEGRATVNGKPIVHPVVPADDVMQAFAYRHLVPAQELVLAVPGRAQGRNQPKVLTPLPVRIPAGGVARVRVWVPPFKRMGGVTLELDEPPAGITIRAVQPAGDGVELVLQCDATKAKVGLAGNLIVTASADRAGKGKAATRPAAAPQRRGPVDVLPAIPFEVVNR